MSNFITLVTLLWPGLCGLRIYWNTGERMRAIYGSIIHPTTGPGIRPQEPLTLAPWLAGTLGLAAGSDWLCLQL